MTKPAKPTRRYPYTEALWSGGQWKWRAVIKVRGVRKRGPIQVEELDAHKDAQGIREHLEIYGGATAGNLGHAFANLVKDARERGVAAKSVKGVYQNPATQILKGYWDGATPLEAIDVEEVRWMVRTAIERGYSTTTIAKSYLRVLHQAFVLANVPSPVPEVRRTMRNALRSVRYDPPYLRLQECGQIVRLMLEAPQPGQRMLDARQRDVDLMLVFMTTGVRAGEFERVTREDLNLEAGWIHIREPKDRTNPRSQPIADLAKKAVGRIRDSLKRGQAVAGSRQTNHMFQRWQKRLPQFDGFRGGRSIRHSFSSGLEDLGAPFSTIQELMGHSRTTGPMTGRYLHSTEVSRRHWVNTLARSIGEASGFELAPEPCE